MAMLKKVWERARERLRERGEAGADIGGEDGDEDDADEAEADVLEPRGHRKETYHPTPAIKIAKHPPRQMCVCDLIDTQSTPNLLRAISQFLRPLLPFDASHLKNDNSVFPVWTQCNLLHNPLPFVPLLGPKVDTIRVFPASRNNEDRVTHQKSFDTVLIDMKNGLQGVHGTSFHVLRSPVSLAYYIKPTGYCAGQVRAIFQLPTNLHHISSAHLVYIKQFGPFSQLTPNPHQFHSASHFMRWYNRCARAASVVLLADVKMTCQLTPQYRTVDPDLLITASTDLLSICCQILSQ
jgi:hypothetical protein